MDKSNLLRYAKNTDASSTIGGFNYQTLKTLELWLENHILNMTDEVIYCEYLDDVFQQSTLTSEVKFTQVKLYSTNFSFASDEIQKTILNFFMLDLKSDFLVADKKFSFETNSSIARRCRNNDADLLNEWYTHQENIPSELLQKIAPKLKVIIQKNLQPEMINDQDSLKFLEDIPNGYWEQLATKIKWSFLNTSPDEEIYAIKERITDAIEKLPYPSAQENSEIILSKLYTIVSLKMSEKNVENKKLTYQLLADSIMLISNESDTWYVNTLASWTSNKKSATSAGEIIEITNASRYCRRRNYLSNDVKKWAEILKFTIDEQLLNSKYLKIALYEYLLLNILPDYETKIPTGNLTGQECYVTNFFGNFDWLTEPKTFENCAIMLSYIATIVQEDKINIRIDGLNNLIPNFETKINNVITSETDKNRTCAFLEIKSNFYFSLSLHGYNASKSMKESFDTLDILISTVPMAPLYDISLFGYRLNSIMNIMIKLDYEKFSYAIEKFDNISNIVGTYIAQRGGSHNEAMLLMKRASSYIQSSNKKGILRALRLFHQAKDKFYHAESRLNFIICLICISKIYYNLRLHYAAKYYALAAYFVSDNSNIRTDIKHKKIIDSLEEIFNNDFISGSWLSAMHDFYLIIGFINNFETETKLICDEDLQCLSANYVFISYSSKQIIPELKYMIESKHRELEGYYEAIIDKNDVELNSKFSNFGNIISDLEGVLTDYPLLEIGTNRKISFKAIGLTWRVNSKNNFAMSIMTEDFVSLLQILIAEISLSEIDLYLHPACLEIEIIISSTTSDPQQISDNNISKWKVFLHELTDAENVEEYYFKMISQIIFIFNDLSLAPQDEFMSKIEQIQQNTNFLQNGFIVNNYQYLIKQIIDGCSFESFSRNHFQTNTNFIEKIQLNNESEILKFKLSLCDKYNEDKVIEDIKMRYINTGKSLRYTIPKLKIDETFIKNVHILRELGWKDWEILSAIANISANQKINQFTKNQGIDILQVSNDKLHNLMLKFITEEETEVTNIDICIDRLIEALNCGVINFLNTNHLSCRSRTPQLSSIKDFINKRMNVANDDIKSDINLLSNI